MSYEKEKQNIHNAIKNYSDALNAADAASLPNYFTGDGKFMPEGIKSIDSKQLAISGEKHLAKTGFQIRYSVQDITIFEDFAFASARANSSHLEPGSGLSVTKTSRDFFVFKKVGGEWKIYRYMFNNIR